MATLDKIWLVGDGILPPDRNMPAMSGMLLLTSPNFQEFERRIGEDDRITLICEDKYAEAIQENFGDRIETVRVGISNPSLQLFESQLRSLQAELRLIHDYSVAEELAWSGGVATEAKVIRRITEAMVRIFACETNKTLQNSLSEILNEFTNTDSVRLFIDPPYAPLAELKLQDLAIPIQFEGKLYAHLYVKLNESIEDKELVIEELSELLIGLTDVIGLAIERNLVLENATHSRHLWQASFDAIEDPLVIIDSELIVLQANRSYLELVGKDSSSVLHRECPLFQMNEIKSYFSFPRSEWELSYANRSFRVFLDKLKHSEGENRFVIRMQDFTREKKLRETMMAREQRSNLGVLISSVAHDINNPIGGILAYCQLLEKEYAADSQVGEDVSTIKAEAERCQKVIQTMLSLVRVSNTNEERFSVSDCISSVLSLLSPELKRSQIDIEWQDESLIRYDLPKVWGRKEKTLQAIFQTLQELVTKLNEERKDNRRNRRSIQISTSVGRNLLLRFVAPGIENSTDLEQPVSYYLSSILLEEQGGSLEIKSIQGNMIYEFSFPLNESNSIQ